MFTEGNDVCNEHSGREINGNSENTGQYDSCDDLSRKAGLLQSYRDINVGSS